MNLPPETLNMLPFGALFVRPDLRVEFVNHWLTAQLDVPLETLLGKNLLEAFPEIGDANRLYAFRLVLDTGQPVTLAAALHEYLIRLEPHPGAGLEYMPQDVHLLPVFGKDDSVEGVLVLIYDRSHTVSQKRLLDEEIHRTRLLQKIDRVLATLRLDECLRIVAEGMPELLKADRAVVFLRQGDELEVAACAGKCNEPEGTRFSIMEAAFGWVARTGVPLLLDDVRREPHYRMGDENSRSFLGVPLVFQGRVNGVLTVESRARAAFDSHSLEILEMLAARASVAIQNALLYQEAQQRRSYFERILDQSTDIIFTLDADLRLTLVNATWDTLAWENKEPNWIGHRAIQRPILQIIPAEHRAHWQDVLRQILSGEIASYSQDVHWRLGEHSYWFNVRLAPLRQRDGSIAGVVASARDITRATQSRQRLERINQQLGALAEAMQVLNAQIGPSALLDTSVNFLYRILHLSAAAFYVWNSETEEFTLLAGRGLPEATCSLRLPSLDGLPAESLQSFGAVSYLADMRAWHPEFGGGMKMGGLVARVFSRQGLAGVLLACFERRDPTREDRELLEMFSIHFSVAWENVRSPAEKQRLSSTAPLAGLLDRRAFDERLTEALERAARYRAPVSLIMARLGGFDVFRSASGASAAERLLEAVAAEMRRALRRTDSMARLGEDTLLILLPDAELRQGYLVAERLLALGEATMRSSLADARRWEAPGRLLPEGLTLALGVVSAPRHTVDPEILLGCAETALRRAGGRGGRQVIPYWGPLRMEDCASRQHPPPVEEGAEDPGGTAA